MNRRLVYLPLLSLMALLMALAACQTPSTPPVMWRGGPDRTGVFDTANVKHLSGLKWKFATGGPVWSSPVVANGVVYVGSDDNSLYAVDAATGKQKWAAKSGDDVRSSPAVAGGIVYFHSYEGVLYAVDAVSGKERWKFQTFAPSEYLTMKDRHALYDDFLTSPVVAGGLVYIGSPDPQHTLYAVDAATGKLRWSYDRLAYEAVRSSPTVAGGLVYIGGEQAVYALDAATGAEKWSFATKGMVWYPAAVGGGLLFVGSQDANLYALDAATGVEKWHLNPTKSTSWVTSGPALGDGVVYASSSIGCMLHAVRIADGQQLWQFKTGGWVWSSPALVKGVLYVGSGDKNLYAVDASTGQELWHYTTGGEVYSSPFVANATVFFGSLDGSVYAVN
jgi:eukaryotic-like serine/threonine-protein kinase